MVHREPRPYQSAALAAWRAAGCRGVDVLPTGAGKTLVAHLAIDDRKRSALVVTPTLDLVRQWHDGLCASGIHYTSAPLPAGPDAGKLMPTCSACSTSKVKARRRFAR